MSEPNQTNASSSSPAKQATEEDASRDTGVSFVASANSALSVVVPHPHRKRRSSSVSSSGSSHKKRNEATTTTTTTTTRNTVKPLEKSTVTTVGNAQINVYDAVLSEASDLWQAASEAQQLGRLKMASSYLLLLHARLVGLGKRFDKAEGEHKKFPWPTTTTTATTTTAITTTTTDSLQTPKKKTTAQNILTPNTAKVLEKMLPQDIELDQAMMEHLAKAAAELHAARSGRKRHATEWNPGMTGYDYYPASGSSSSEFHHHRNMNTTAASAAAPVANTGIVWSLQEIRILQQALETQGEPDALQLAKQLGRNPAQVKAFLRNQNTKSRLAADLALEPGAAQSPNPAASSSPSTPSATGVTADTPRRKGGRGPKPPTTALHTVPNAECNASLLLQGGFLPPDEDPEQLRETAKNDKEKDEEKSAVEATTTIAAAAAATNKEKDKKET